MSDNEYTPTAAEVKSAWVGSKPNIGMLVVRDRHAAEFERFVAVIREDQAKVLEEAHADLAWVKKWVARPGGATADELDELRSYLSQSFTGTEEQK